MTRDEIDALLIKFDTGPLRGAVEWATMIDFAIAIHDAAKEEDAKIIERFENTVPVHAAAIRASKVVK